jgi:hypothetical protein
MSIRFYRPEKVTVCARLAGDHQAGVLLYAIMQRYRYAKATLAGIEGTWSANQRAVWFKAAGLSDTQGDRALAKLDKRGLIERKHGSWGGKPNVLFVRPTERAQAVWDSATTFDALDQVLEGDESGQLYQLWEAWPDIDPKKAGEIAVWYEQLDKLSNEIYGKPLNLKSCALALLQLMLKSDPTIADAKAEDLLGRLIVALKSITIEVDEKGGLAPAGA